MIKYATIIIGALFCLEAIASDLDNESVLKSQTQQKAIAELREKIRREQEVIDKVRTELQKASASIKRDTSEPADNPYARNAIETLLNMRTNTQRENLTRYQKQLDALSSGTQTKSPYEVEPVQYGEWPN
jgi:Skp family chaperone for outer membrane proteins